MDRPPVHRLFRQEHMLIDASFGRKTRSVLVMDDGHIVWSSLPTEQVSARFGDIADQKDEMEEELQ